MTTLPLLLLLALSDPRDIRQGRVIPTESYADQPYVVQTDDGAWLVCVTTGAGREGESGQHVITMRSTDQGRTWSKPRDVEPAQGPESSYAVMLKAPGGRIYIFYNHNTDNVREVIADRPAYPDGLCRRVDSLGHFVFKYSDDHGRSWSSKRYDIPMREFEIDRRNPYGGKLKFFWNVGKAFAFRGAAYVPLHKVGGFGEGFFTSSEGVLLRSDNLLTERDPARIRWGTLPDGDVGIRAPAGGGPIAEEQSFVELSDGSLFCVFRTIDGYPAFTYSRDGGRSWEPSEYMRYADGRRMKHPRAANFVWRTRSGKYLYWFHNHGGRFIREHAQRRTVAFRDRNPAWLAGGVEADSPRGKVIRWSQPEIALYDADPAVRMSYPDFIEDGGRYFLTETQKSVARVHEVDAALIEGRSGAPRPGFSVDLAVRFRSLRAGQVLAEGRGVVLRTTDRGTVELVMSGGGKEDRWECDAGMLATEILHHVTVIVDGGPKIVLFVVDGKLNDGGEERQFGWGRFQVQRSALGGRLRRGSGLDGSVERLRLYPRALRVSEAIAVRR